MEVNGTGFTWAGCPSCDPTASKGTHNTDPDQGKSPDGLASSFPEPLPDSRSKGHQGALVPLADTSTLFDSQCDN